MSTTAAIVTGAAANVTAGDELALAEAVSIAVAGRFEGHITCALTEARRTMPSDRVPRLGEAIRRSRPAMARQEITSQERLDEFAAGLLTAWMEATR